MSLKGSFASVLAHFHDVRSTPNGEQTATSIDVGFVPIVLQKSKVAGPPIFRETTKQEAIADSCKSATQEEKVGDFRKAALVTVS